MCNMQHSAFFFFPTEEWGGGQKGKEMSIFFSSIFDDL